MRRISPGAANISGINAQAWAALSLFIQCSGQPDFVKVQLEQPNLADFILVFKDKNIICEAKKYRISYASIRSILDTIPQIGEKDEILIICESLSDKIPKEFENATYFPEVAAQLLKKRRLLPDHLSKLPRLRFWAVGKKIDRTVVKSLLLQRLGTWVPEDDLEMLLTRLLVTNIYDRSATGGQYSGAEFNGELQDYKKRLVEKDDHLSSKRSTEAEVRKLIDELTSPTESRLQADGRLSALVTQRKYHYFALEYLKTLDHVPIGLLDKFWEATTRSYYARSVFSILKERVVTEDDAAYVVGFVERHAKEMRYWIMNEFRYREAASLLAQARNVTNRHDETIAQILMGFYADTRFKAFHGASSRDYHEEWMQEDIANFLRQLFTETLNPVARQGILSFINDNFNLVEDRSFRHLENPHPFFGILREAIGRDPVVLDTFGRQIAAHYDAFYQQFSSKQVSFDGWDLFGSGVSFMGRSYDVKDSGFIGAVMIPVLSEMDPDSRWAFVVSHVTTEIELVSHERPDFYNRAAIPCLIEEFASGAHSGEAREILSSFIRMRKGIPFKADLVYRSVRDAEMMPDKKWELLRIGLQEYGYPINVFMDEILRQLIVARHPEALTAFVDVLKSADYLRRQSDFGVTLHDSLTRLIDDPPTSYQGIELLRAYIESEHFKKHLNLFDAYEYSSAFLGVLRKDSSLGIGLLRSLIGEHTTDNQQAVFGSVIREAPDSVGGAIYRELIDPLLAVAGNAINLSKTLTRPDARENILWFAEKLAKGGQYEEALCIAEFFLDDPEPSEHNDYDRQIAEGKSNLSIGTPRGVIPWVLRQTCTPNGRAFIPRSFSMTRTLCFDPSGYVRDMAAISLEAHAGIRHARMARGDEWLVQPEIAEEIESLAFEMLHREENHVPAIMTRLAMIFNRIRTLNEGQAMEVIESFEHSSDDDVLEDLSGFIVFMSEFRQGAFPNWPDERGLIAPFDPAPVRRKLEQLLRDGPDGVRRSLAWQFVKLPGELSDEDSRFDQYFSISRKYLSVLARHHDHLMFQSIYQFIERYIDKRFDECYQLWKLCLETERAAIMQRAATSQANEYSWWPYYQNDTVLLKVADQKGADCFIQDFSFLLEYPNDVIAVHQFDKLVHRLSALEGPQAAIDNLFRKLIDRDPKIIVQYDEWKAHHS